MNPPVRIFPVVAGMAVLGLMFLLRTMVSVDPIGPGRSVEGRPLPIDVYGDGPKTILIMATIHGNEEAGTPLLQTLSRWLDSEEGEQLLAGRRVVILPVVNPDGLAADRRFNQRGVDLNRNFPATNRQNSERYGMVALSEPEARWIKEVLDHYQPEIMVSLHQPVACVDYDGPAEELARVMSAACRLP
ncbi:MAG: DUF2817 domain-containing protein, partial [Verrucomicrobiota bacterium]